MDDIQISDQLAGMLEHAIGIDIDHLNNGRKIQTWILSRRIGSNELSLQVITGHNGNEMEIAREAIRKQKDEIGAYVIGMNGRIMVEGSGYVNGLFYEVEEKGSTVSLKYMAGYSFDENGQVKMDGNHGFYREGSTLLSEQ